MSVINSPAVSRAVAKNHNKRWWKESVVYQIYPRSFNDSNGDGIGDLNGITSKLDYLKDLGVDVIWLSPVYSSPNHDNGYDVSDYHNIMTEFGTMADWEKLLQEMHKRDLKIVMDLVLNHTSDEHQWFVESRKSKDNPFRDYYIWRPPRNNALENGGGKGEYSDSPVGSPAIPNRHCTEPNNWVSFFGGSAWQLDEATGEYYLHLFGKKQPDLNWENPKVRKEINDLILFWLDKGVDGFRLDVINVISKEPGLPDAPVKNPGDMYHWAGEHFYNGPRFMEWMSDVKKNAFDKYNIFTVGETPDVTTAHGREFTAFESGVLNMLFHFELMGVDIQPGKTKWESCDWKLEDVREIMTRWQTELDSGWNSLYLENHDQPRSTSRFGSDGKFRELSAKMMATWLHMMKGTPYIYQGQELGMTNVEFSDVSELRDLEALFFYHDEMRKGVKSKEEIFRAINLKSRDNARTPMQWSDAPNAGFTASNATPWIKVNPNYTQINAEQQQNDPKSVLNYYKRLIRLRKQHQVMVYGEYELIMPLDPQIYAYLRTLDSTEQLVVMANFRAKEGIFSLSAEDQSLLLPAHAKQELLISTHDEDVDEKQNLRKSFTLRPYEARVFKLTVAE